MEVVDQTKLDSVGFPDKGMSKKRGCLIVILVTLIFLVGFWFVVRPRVFTIQPIGALPEGITVIYHSRGPQMPLFSSPDGLCLEMQGSVTLLCRVAALSVAEEIADRIILRLPYSEFAYLQSTGGSTFDR